MIHPQPPHPDAIRRAVMAAYGRNDAVLSAHPYIEDRSGYVGTARPRRIAGSGSFDLEELSTPATALCGIPMAHLVG